MSYNEPSSTLSLINKEPPTDVNYVLVRKSVEFGYVCGCKVCKIVQ